MDSDTKELLDKCLYAFNILPNAKFTVDGKTTTTYKLASEIETTLKKSFIVSKREVHISFEKVKASNAEEAIEKVKNRSADCETISTEYSHDMPKEFWTVEEAK